MYTEYLSQQEAPREAPSRQAPPARRAAPRRRDPRRDRQRRMLLALAALVLFLAGFISGCCVGRGHSGGAENGGEGSGTGGVGTAVKPQKSNIPASITLPDYVKEDLLPVNEYSRCGDKLKRVNAVVIHYVGNPNTTARQNRSYFENLATSGETSASSNLIVGLDGEGCCACRWTRWPIAPTTGITTPCPSSSAIPTLRASPTRPPMTRW